jgi:hypothetical protein
VMCLHQMAVKETKWFSLCQWILHGINRGESEIGQWKKKRNVFFRREKRNF